MRGASARTLAGAGITGTGAAAAVAAYLLVGGLPGMLYSAGICLAAVVGAVTIVRGRAAQAVDVLELPTTATVRAPRWGRKARLVAELQLELAATGAELEEHRQACANLAAQLTRESDAARQNAEQLEEQIRGLEAERDSLLGLLTDERQRFEQTLEALGWGIGRHGTELAELERELEALIAR